MPQRVKQYCSIPGCSNLVDRGRCAEHRTKAERVRGSAAARGYGERWRRYRRSFLAGHPLCVRCEEGGIVRPATDVDHIIPVHGPSDPLFWEPSNHQALCHSHHSAKTVNEDGGFGR